MPVCPRLHIHRKLTDKFHKYLIRSSVRLLDNFLMRRTPIGSALPTARSECPFPCSSAMGPDNVCQWNDYVRTQVYTITLGIPQGMRKICALKHKWYIWLIKFCECEIIFLNQVGDLFLAIGRPFARPCQSWEHFDPYHWSMKESHDVIFKVR